MRKLLLAIIFIICINTYVNAQKSDTSLIKVKLKSSSLLPKKITIITYQPGNTGNETKQILLWPKAATQLYYIEGTKIYIANTKQVEVVMSGKRIDNDKPFLQVKKEDEGKTFIY